MGPFTSTFHLRLWCLKRTAPPPPLLPQQLLACKAQLKPQPEAKVLGHVALTTVIEGGVNGEGRRAWKLQPFSYAF